MSEPSEVPVGQGTIRLVQFLKLANLVESGAAAKPLVASGVVRVNGESETRRGRQLVAGDLVEVAGVSVRVSDAEARDGRGDSQSW